MGSVRLPRKALLPLGGKPMTVAVLDRVTMAATMRQVVAAIPDTTDNDQLAGVIRVHGYDVIRGPEDDLWRRFLRVLDATGADVIVRVTGDEPLVDPDAIDAVVGRWLLDTRLDFVHNCWGGRSWPDGCDVELVRADAVRREADVFTQRFTNTCVLYRSEYVMRAGTPLGHLNWCVDVQEQYDGVCAVYARLGPTCTTEEIVQAFGAYGLAEIAREIQHRKAMGFE